MATIKIGFSSPKKWFSPFSWLIRLFDGTPYSHTYIRFYSADSGEWMVYQASSLMVNYMNQDLFYGAENIYREFSLTVSDEVYASVLRFAADNAGQPYDLKSVLGIAIVKVAALFGKKIDKNPLTGNGFFCSLLVGDILVEKIGDKLPGDPNLWTPSVIYDALSKGI